MAETMTVRLSLEGVDVVTAGIKRVAKALESLQGAQRAAASLTANMPDLTSPLKGAQSAQKLVKSATGGLLSEVAADVGLLAGEVVIAAAGIRLLWGAATEAAESLTKFRDSMVVTGGTAQEVGRLKSFGDAAGVSDMAAAARQLSEKIQSSGVTQGLAANKGIYDYGGDAFGPLDKARNLQKAIAVILDPKTTDTEALRFARVLGLEPFVKMRDLSEQTRKELERAGDANTMAHSPAATKNALEFDAAMSILSTNFDRMKTLVGDSVLPLFTAVVRIISSMVDGLSNLYQALKPVVDQLLALGKRDVKPTPLAKKLFPDMFADDPHTTALNRNTDATNANTTAFQGGIGGGPNAARALPGAYRSNGGQSANWIGNAQSLGGMGV